MKSKKSKPTKRARVNMRFPEDLLGWVKDYADKSGKTLTQVFIDYAEELRRKKHGKTSVHR